MNRDDFPFTAMINGGQTSSNGISWLDAHRLRPRYRLFVLSYLKTHNATQSATEAGYKKPKQQGTRMLSNVAVRAAITDGQARIEEQAMLNAEGIVRMWGAIATADVNELISLHIGACRYCHGINHEFQWTSEREYREARVSKVYELFSNEYRHTAALQGEVDDPRIPTNEGGYGYRVTSDPNPDCPECSGVGIERVRMADTRSLAGGAKLLFNGVVKTQHGKKVLLQDRARALENLARHFGMFAGKLEVDKTSPLTGLITRIMASASSAPIKPS